MKDREETTHFARVTFLLDSDQQALVAEVHPTGGARQVVAEELQQLLASEPYASYEIKQDIFQRLVAQAQNNEPCRVLLGIKRPAQINFQLSDDGKIIFAHVEPACGEQKRDSNSLRAEFSAANFESYFLLADDFRPVLALAEQNEEVGKVPVAGLYRAQVEFKKSTAGDQLQACVQPKIAKKDFKREQLEQVLSQPEYRTFVIDEVAFEALQLVCHNNDRQEVVVVASHHEADVEFEITADQANIHAKIQPCARIGKLTEQSLRDALAATEYDRFYIDEEGLQAVLAALDENNNKQQINIGLRKYAKVVLDKVKDANGNSNVYAKVLPAMSVTAVTRKSMLALLAEQGYEDYYFCEDQWQKLKQKCSDNSEKVKLVIAEQRDAKVKLNVSADSCAAICEYTPAFAGNRVTADEIDQLLVRKGICYGLGEEALITLKAMLISNIVQGITSWKLAVGKLPIDGRDSEFVNLYEQHKQRIEEKEQHAVKDGKALNFRASRIDTVESDVLLMRIDPPTEGEPGKDVYGKLIQQKQGVWLSFDEDLDGVVIDPDNDKQLLSARGGCPVVIERGMRVDPVIEVEKVNLITGDIDFDGTVIVKGDIVAGATVRCSCDLLVSGTVESAQLYVGGDIKVAQGMVCPQPPEHSLLLDLMKRDADWSVAHIQCDGDIEANFIRNCIITAKGNIQTQSGIRHSLIYAGRDIHVIGKPSSSILAGLLRVDGSVIANNLGSDSFLKTEIVVAQLAETEEHVVGLKVQARDQLQKLEKLQQQYALIKKQNVADEVREKIATAIASLKTKFDTKLKRIKAIEAKLELARSATVSVKNKIFPGVSIHIDEHVQHFKRRSAGGVIRLAEDGIVYKPQ